MPTLTANEIDIAYAAAGSGDPLVLVHGSWSDRHNWDPVAGALARAHHVVAYDRRGHGRSERPAVQGTRRDQEDDLAALIEGLGAAPAHIAGTSFGASIALGLAARRPELVRSVVAHEPPLMALAAGDPRVAPLLAAVEPSIRAVIAHVEAGDAEAGARRFVEEVALGPGAWAHLPEPLRATMRDSASAFVAEQRDPAWASLALDELAAIGCPVLLTQGVQSPAWFAPIIARLASAIGDAEVATYSEAGHAPHVTHPAAYLDVVSAFLARVREPAVMPVRERAA